MRNSTLVAALLVVTVSVRQPQHACSQESQWIPECTIDLKVPGIMSDVLSNVLLRRYGKPETDVREFLVRQTPKCETGYELAMAAAKQFGLKEAAMIQSVEDFRHCNCSHAGGEEFYRAKTPALSESDGKVSDFAEKVLIHVVLHELGHAIVREFDLPILGNEETLADAFATHYLLTELPDQAFEVLEARVSSLMIEAGELPRSRWTVKGEHNSDARRAYQIVALAVAEDRVKYSGLAALVQMNEQELTRAVDYASEIHRSWRRILRPLRMPPGMASREVRIGVDSDSQFAESLHGAAMFAVLETAMRSFDWHSSVALYFADGEDGAGWSRSRRTITVHDDYIHRFNCQGLIHAQRIP
ncbi:MAG: DUF4344 domain-containing metallopeptidase [Planctomycetota bacterium]